MKRVKGYKGFIIKERGSRDDIEIYTYKYYIFRNEPYSDPIWECDSFEEAIEFIDCY